MERTDKVGNLIKQRAAEFLQTVSNRQSLITVTSATVSPDLKRATVFITVLPESQEKIALGFAKRQRREMREHLKKHMNTKVVPFLEVEIDRGEKNRQKIDELLRG